jgi:hypothetical protein
VHKFLENLKLGSFENNAITGATISPDASRFFFYVIVRFGFFKTSLQIIFLAGEVSEFKLNHFRKKRQFALKTIRHS